MPRWHRHSCLCVLASSEKVEPQPPSFSPAGAARKGGATVIVFSECNTGRHIEIRSLQVAFEQTSAVGSERKSADLTCKPVLGFPRQRRTPVRLPAR